VSIAAYILLATVIALLWLAVGYHEWRPPASLEKKIKDFCQIQVRDSYQRQEAVQLVLNIACWERLLPDLEKLIYLWQKKHKKGMENYVIRLYIRSAGGVDQKELRKAKLRLEHRFRGLTVYYCKTGEEHVVYGFNASAFSSPVELIPNLFITAPFSSK
jgi:hypothetical protein